MCPPGVDQTTRTRERWTLLAPTLEERYDVTDDLSDDYELGLAKFFKGDFTWEAFAKLAVYERPMKKARSLLSALPQHRQRARSSLFESMPTEIISMILTDQELEPHDIVSFGLTSKTLWTHALDHIIKACQKAPWAGTPLLCTGTWTMSLSEAIHAIMPNLKKSTLATAWTLRNHTTRERVSLKVDRMNGKQEWLAHVEGACWLPLDQAILLRICWSVPFLFPVTLDEEDDRDREDDRARLLMHFKRGRWAGHCFDIIPSNRDSDTVTEDWRDVTDEIIKEAAAVKAMFKQSRSGV